jgi:hypothetical protein
MEQLNTSEVWIMGEFLVMRPKAGGRRRRR